MLTAVKIKQKKISSLGCRKKVKKMPSLAESLRIAKVRESEKNSRIKSTENNRGRSKYIIKNYFTTDISESSAVELRSKPDVKTSKNSNRRYTNNLVSAHKTERKLVSHETTPLLEEYHQNQILDKNSPSKEIIERKFLDDKRTQNENKIIFVSLDFLEDCQKYKKKFIKPMCSEGLKNLRKGLKSISSYRKGYLTSTEQIPKSQKGDGPYKQTIRSKNMSPKEIENAPSNNLEKNKIQKSESPENEVKVDVNVKQNKPPEYQNVMNDWDVPDTDIISMNKSLNVKPSSEDVSTVDKNYIELLLSIANSNKTKENKNLNDSNERDYDLRQPEKKIISGKTFFENKIKKEKPVKHLKSVEETDQKISEKTLHEENNAPTASQESTVLARLVRDMTKSEVQIQHKNNNTTHSRRFSEIQNEKKTAYSKPEVRENPKKRKTRNNVLKNNNEEVIEMQFPSETSKGSDLKELWRRETRNKSENSLSSRSSSTMQEKEILQHINSGLDSYKLLRKIVEAEVKTICKKFVEDIHSDQEINKPAEKNSQCDKKSAQLQEVFKGLRAMMNENTSEIFHVKGSKTDEAKLTQKAVQEQSLTKEDRRKKNDLLEYLNKCTELEVNLEDKKKKCPSDTVKHWSILHRLENAFLALGTPSFPSKKAKNSSVSKMTRKSDLQKNGKVDVKSNEEYFYNRSKKLQKTDLSDTKEKKDLLGKKEKKNLLENKAKENLLGNGEKKDMAGNRKEENISGNVKKKNFLVKKEKENLSRNHEQKKMLRNKDKKELIRNKERKMPVPVCSNEQNRNDMKESHMPKHLPVRKLPVSPRNKSSERGSKRLLTKEKPQETKNTKNDSSQSEALISHRTACEDKMKQKKSKLDIRKSIVIDIKKEPQRSLGKPESYDSESKSPKNILKPKTNKNSVIKNWNLEKTIPEESKPDELEVRKPSETTVAASNWLHQNENENLERKKTFDIITVDVLSKIKPGKSKSCNEMDDTLEMNAFRNRFPPTRSAEHKRTHFWDFSKERERKNYGGAYNIKPVLPRKMLVKGKPLRHLGRPKTLSQKDRLRGNREQKTKSKKHNNNTEKKSEEAVPMEDLPGPNPLAMETSPHRALKKRSILSIRGSQAQRQNLLSLQGKSVNMSVESEPAEEVTDLAKDAEITLPTYVAKEAPDIASYSPASTCTFDLKASNHEYISNKDDSPMVILNDETIKDAERPEELSSFSSLSVYTSEQPDIENDEKEYIKSKKIWERDMKQYRALVKEIMSHYRRIDGFLKENEHSQSFSSDCGRFSSSETTTNKTGKVIDNLQEITIDEYRRKILSEYEALPIFEYKSKIQQETGSTNLDEKRRNLHFVKPLKTELDIDVKDFKPNTQKILDSELYVDTENKLRRTELFLKFNEKKSSLQEILLNKTGKKVGEEECLRCISTPKAFPLLSRARDNSYSMQSFLTKVSNNGDFGLETVMLKI